MQIDIRYKPSYPLGFIALDGGEEVRVEGSAMVSMSNDQFLAWLIPQLPRPDHDYL